MNGHWINICDTLSCSKDFKIIWLSNILALSVLNLISTFLFILYTNDGENEKQKYHTVRTIPKKNLKIVEWKNWGTTFSCNRKSNWELAIMHGCLNRYRP
jgi:hypothetical protein